MHCETTAGALVELVPAGQHVSSLAGDTLSGELGVSEIGIDGRVSRINDGKNVVNSVR
jgi:hypothetical protein